MQRAVTVAVVGLAIVLVDEEKVEKDKVLGMARWWRRTKNGLRTILCPMRDMLWEVSTSFFVSLKVLLEDH